MEGQGEPAEITRIKSELETMAASSEQSGSWLASAMEASWSMAEALLSYPQLADLLAERHKIIGNNWQNASTAQLIARYLRRAVSIMERVDFSPAGLRKDLAGARSAPSYLYSAAELVNHAADLSAASSVLTHENERRWRIFRERVEQIPPFRLAIRDAAAIWLGMALLALVVSIRIAVPALVEIVVGALAGKIPGIGQHVTQTEFVTFLASVGSRADLPGRSGDRPRVPPGHWKASLSIGLVSFLLPLLAAFGFCRLVLGWRCDAAEIGGIAPSTTSVAVVYAVMVETGLNRHDLGKLILAACFITDLGTVPALGGLVATYGWLLIVFVAETAVTMLLLPRLVRFAITRFGHRVSEPEIKLLVVLFGLGGLATQAGSEAVLPA